VIGKRLYAMRLNEGSRMKAEPMTPAVDILAGRISQMEPIVRIQCYDSSGGVAGSCMPTAVTSVQLVATRCSRSRAFGPCVVRCLIASSVLEVSHVRNLSLDVLMRKYHSNLASRERQKNARRFLERWAVCFPGLKF
jgi:hypothetical protein